MKSLLDWIDHRTGIRSLTREALFENIPGGSRWRYVWGSTLTFTIFVQFVTGVFLWMGYSATSGDACESINYIQNEMTGGWLLRGSSASTSSCSATPVDLAVAPSPADIDNVLPY